MIDKKELIVLISEKISDRVLMLSRLWQGSGYSTCLVYCYESVTFNRLPNVDVVIKASSPAEAVAISLKISKKILHYFNYGPDVIGQYLLAAKQNYIYDYKDLFYRVRSTTLPPGFSDIEIALINGASYITNRDHQIYNYLQINNVNFSLNKLLYVPEYFETNFEYERELAISESRPKKGIKVVMTGGFDQGVSLNSEILYEGVDRVLKILIDNDITISIIGNYSNINNLDSSIDSRNFDKRINVVKSLDSTTFDYELLKYDYAIHLINNDIAVPTYSINYINSEHLSFCGSARLYSYVKAGLPILMGKSMRFNRKVFEKTGYVIDIDSLMIADIRETLLQLKFNGYDKKLLPYRNLYGYEAALENFSTEIRTKLILNNEMK